MAIVNKIDVDEKIIKNAKDDFISNRKLQTVENKK
jgi:hypothetical protein